MGHHYGAGTILKRGNIYYVSYWVDGKQHMKSSGSSKLDDAKKLRDELLGKKSRGELPAGNVHQKVTCGELLGDLVAHSKAHCKASTVKIWELVINAHLVPFFGRLKAASITTERLHEYRAARIADQKTETTCNRELALLRMAFNLGRKQTPPKILNVPYFPMVKEDNARQGFLSDENYPKLRDALPDYLKPWFVVAYHCGVRKGELLAWKWDQVDFDHGLVTLEAANTKTGRARVVPILAGDMRTWLEWSRDNADGCPWVFHNEGKKLESFRKAWATACKKAGIPDFHPHDLRRTAVRNMRRDGVPQVVRMRISGHRTDSMERRYNIVDSDDIEMARGLMEKRGERGK
jgi:integrase